MSELARILDANRTYARTHERTDQARPARGVAIVSCMDARVDVAVVLGLERGDAHVVRNAGARVTDDVLRSLAVSTHVTGVDTVVVMQHTDCAMAATTDEQLRARTGADLEFFTIDDHHAALRQDIETLSAAPFLQRVTVMAGFLYDVETGVIDEVVRSER